ncbi:MAG: GntR family transcriptional regulator [Acidobacteria bacterium]|nr:GntR family transcriptional regulator [Acidobacteriota bacterium]
MTARTALPTDGRIRLVDRAYEEIRRRILDHEYAPSQQVLEQDLAAELGMSRTPVREALVRLAHEQLVQLVPRHGMRVVPLSLQDLRDVYEVITALELAAIERLIRMRPKAVTLTSLDRALDAMDAATARGRTDAWVRADERFHSLLLGLCGNARLVALASSLSDQLHRARLATVRLRRSLEPSNREHRAVVEAIHRGNLRDAQRHHTRHRARTSREILGLLEQTRLGSF